MMHIDARGWIGISVFALTIMVLWMIAAFPELRNDEFFKVLATAIVLTGYVGGPVAWAYQATKQGGELADRAASLAETATTSPLTPQPVKVVNPPAEPVPTAESSGAAAAYTGPDLSVAPSSDAPEEPTWR
ncbi:MAG TPA: hypothetical protein VFJ46_17815 [Xanthobacteraceae bacterium]|nr:hypothetical protein [Xanthobacteraceae bacterium]